MKKGVLLGSFTLLLLNLSACITLPTNRPINPVLDMAQEIPIEAAMAWIKKTNASVKEDFFGACRLDDTGLTSKKDGKHHRYSTLTTYPTSGLDFGYEMWARDNGDDAYGVVYIKRVEKHGLFDKQDMCIVFEKHIIKPDPARIAELKKEVEKTLIALKTVGVNVGLPKPDQAE